MSLSTDRTDAGELEKELYEEEGLYETSEHETLSYLGDAPPSSRNNQHKNSRRLKPVTSDDFDAQLDDKPTNTRTGNKHIRVACLSCRKRKGKVSYFSIPY